MQRHRNVLYTSISLQKNSVLRALPLLLLLAPFCIPSRLSAIVGVEKPKIRAITAFVQIDRAHYREQIAETLKMLRHAKMEFEKGGYEVESVRITTQPFPEYVRGLSREQALEFFRAYDELAIKESFAPNIGPAMI